MLNRKLGFSWHLTLTSLEKVFGKKLIGLRMRYPNIRINNHQYKPGGPDQVNLSIKNTGTALKLIKDDDILRAIRLFNLRLMKKGACVYSRNHCLSLADRLVD